MTVADVGENHLVALRGEIDISNAEAVHNILIEVAGSRITLDLSELSFVDATGLTALVQAKRSLESLGHELSVVGARGLVRRVIEISGLGPELSS